MSDLTVQARHLTIPECALFSPSELTIAPNCTQNDFVRIVKAVAALDTAEGLWVADASLYAIEHFGREKGLEIMAGATSYKTASLLKVAHVASEFPPSKRVNGLSYDHYRRLLAFPRDWAFEFIKRHAGEGLSSRGFYAFAVKEFGSAPYKNKQPKRRAVYVHEELYSRLRPFSNRKVSHFIEGLLEEWLKQHPDVPAPVIPAPVVVNEPRPPYAERRKQQIADGAAPIPAKRKRSPVKLCISWTPCSPQEFVDLEGGPVPYKGPGARRATKFWSLEDAVAAEEKNFEEKKYREEVRRCEVCKCWHIYHRFSDSGRAVTAVG